MGIIAPVPHHYPVVPKPVIDSFLIDDSLKDERRELYSILLDCYDIYNGYFKDQEHPLVTPETAEWALRHTDHTTLMPNKAEGREWMLRLAFEAADPVPMRSICAQPDKIGPVIEYLKDHPDVRISVVTGFPHSAWTPENAKREIDNVAKILKDVKNPVDIDTVANYSAWMDGDHELVRKIMEAESQACKEHGFTWKCILKVSVHAFASKNEVYGSDTYRSIRDMGMMALEAGADCIKTSTGQAAMQPYNDFVKKDVGHIPLALMMMSAIAEFNKNNNTHRWPKFSGGHESEADAAVFRYAMSKVLPEVENEAVFGANYRFRKRLLNYLAEQGREMDPKLLMPHGIETDSLPRHLTGLPDPRQQPKINQPEIS